MFPCGVTEKNVGDAIIGIFGQYQKDSSVEVTLYISSTGGDIDSAIRFYDFIKSSKVNLKTVGFGQVDSAAVILLLSSKERTLIKDCRVRLHQLSYTGAQQSQVLSIHLETTSLLQNLDKRYFEIMSFELGMEEAKVRDLLEKGCILNIDEATNLKIATKSANELPVER